VNESDLEGAVPLHWAAFGGHEDIVDMLLRAGASTDMRATSGDWSGMRPVDVVRVPLLGAPRVVLYWWHSTVRRLDWAHGTPQLAPASWRCWNTRPWQPYRAQ